MPENPLHQPHDTVFRNAFRQKETAIAALQAYLPEAWRRHLDLSTLELRPGTLIDEHFRVLESDLLFSVQLRNGLPAVVYILFEHQSYADWKIALRLLGYMVRIWEEYLRKHPDTKTLPVIFPVVLAQQAGEWRHSVRFSALFDLSAEQTKDFGTAIPDFAFHLIQLAHLAFDKIVGTPHGIMALRVLKASPLGLLYGPEVWDEPLMAQLTEQFLAMLLEYIYDQGDLDEAQFVKKIEELRESSVRQNVMTLAQRLVNRGREEGRVEGRQEGWAEGRHEGREEGVLIGRIEVLQDILRKPVTDPAVLSAMSLTELQRLHAELAAEQKRQQSS